MSVDAGDLKNTENSNQNNIVYSLSWIAYIPSTIMFAVGVIAFISLIVQGVLFFGFSLFIVACYGIYDFLYRRSIKMIVNDEGVWLYRGILPWSKGMTGIKWRDVEDAVYFTGFISYVAKSYTVRIGHRFTKTSEIILKHVADGDKAVGYINGTHQKMIEKGLK